MTNYTCEKCSFTTTIKTHYNRHLDTEKHKLNCSPLSQQLTDLKKQEAAMKAELKIKEIQQKAELKLKEMDLKQQIKDDLVKTEEKVLSRGNLEKAIPLITLMERVIDRPTLEDYNDIFNGVTTFEDIFLRDFLEEYAQNKSIVINKNNKTGYYMNNAPCLWFYTDNAPIKRLFSLIPLYHKYLKEYAKENGCNTKHFTLPLDTQKALEQKIMEEITYGICF